MTRTRSNTQYKLTSLGKIVLAVCLIGLFTLGLFIGKSILQMQVAACLHQIRLIQLSERR